MKHAKIWILNNGILLSNAQTKNIPSVAIETGVSIKEFMHMSTSFWVLDTHGKTIMINAEGADVCGFKSTKDAVGKSLVDVSSKETAMQLIGNCHDVIQVKEPKIYDEINIRKDGLQQQFLSIKLPLYDNQQNVRGVFGVSIVLGRHALADNLNFLQQIGILANTVPATTLTCDAQPYSLELTTQLPARELECLRYIMQGYTSKMIARELGLSFRTVESYIRNLKNRLGVATRFELMQIAKKYKLYGI
jgi:DNA-binding CsgD family transcriptional regulator